jgi:hypothetical protein
MFNTEKFVENLDELLKNPERLGDATPDEWHEYFKMNGYDPKPLSKGNFEHVSFEAGGGFKVNWGGDRILQYHPADNSHHGGAYWKISSGAAGVIWYNLHGMEIRRKGGYSK